MGRREVLGRLAGGEGRREVEEVRGLNGGGDVGWCLILGWKLEAGEGWGVCIEQRERREKT